MSKYKGFKSKSQAAHIFWKDPSMAQRMYERTKDFNNLPYKSNNNKTIAKNDK